MFIVKRNGQKEQVKFEKISKRITRASKGLKNVNPSLLVQKIIGGLYDGVSSYEIDKLSFETAYSLSIKHPEYDTLATRLAISTLHKDTPSTFTEVIEKLHNTHDVLGNKKSLIAENVYSFVKKYGHILNSTINYDRDYLFDYFGFKTLERSYLLKTNDVVNNKTISKIVERPQHMWMRVAIGIHADDVDAALNTYHMLSTKQATHATPTLFNAGMPKNQLASCFLYGLCKESDSTEGVFDVVKECAVISKHNGGIGLHLHDLRTRGAKINGSPGDLASGLVSYMRIINASNKFLSQGGLSSKRKGSYAIYIEPWNSDIFDFLQVRLNHGNEDQRTRDLNIALWVPDLFFKRVEEDKDWTLMDPSVCTGLADVYGDEFVSLYENYEQKKMGERTIKARDVWAAIVEAQIETGEPYILAKDSCNKKSNQKNLGTIKSSNLCISGDAKVFVKTDLMKDGVEIPFVHVMSLFSLHENTPSNIYVLSYDHKKKEKVYSKIIAAALTNKEASVVRVSSKSSSLVCTEDHKFYTGKKYSKAKVMNDKDLFLSDLTFEKAHVESLPNLIPVYDITVENTNNFFANNILVHNCAEIIEYSSVDETAACNLASISLTSCIEDKRGKKTFNFNKLFEITKTLTENLNKVIDVGYYPTEASKKSNLKHRPIGIGIQGLADVLAIMRYSWESEEAKKLNSQIAETMYYAMMDTSSELAKKYGAYSSYENSPVSKGILQCDEWNVTPSNLWDWSALREKIKQNGVRNSLGIAHMPTSSTSQILGNTESFEIITSNIYKRQTLSGEFIQINKYLLNDLIELNLWNDEMRQKIIAHNGSIQNIQEIPDNIKSLYKTVWETSQKVVIDFAADRGPYVCQSQSMNLYVKDPNAAKITSAIFYAWKKGLKTLVYYLRSMAARDAIKFTVDKEIENKAKQDQQINEDLACSLDNPENCEACSS